MLAAVAVAVDPILVYQSSLPMTETLATLLVLVNLNLMASYLKKPSVTTALVLGVGMGGLVLCRPSSEEDSHLSSATFYPSLLKAKPTPQK